MERSATYRYNVRSVSLPQQHFINERLRTMLLTPPALMDEYGPFMVIVPFGTHRLRRALRNFARRLRERLSLISRPPGHYQFLGSEDPM